MKKCPYCNEQIQDDATKCRYCGELLEEIHEATNFDKVRWKWKPWRWWLALIIFWLFSSIGASLFVLSGQSGAASAFIVTAMLAFVIMCISKDRSLKIPFRILYVIGAWIGHAILTIPIGLMVLKGYLPEQLSCEELTSIVKKIIAETPKEERANFGKVMKAAMSAVRGKADGKLVSQIVSRQLSEAKERP